jgi:predicted MFS family arabinose efflux permease
MQEIWRHYRREMIAVALISIAFWFQIAAALSFMSKYLQETHDFAPLDVSMLYIIAGSIAILGNTLAGKVSDHIGRRPTLTMALMLYCAAIIAFYNAGGWLLPLTWIAALFGYFAVEVMVNALSGELFPTRCRSTASTLRAIFAMFAAVAGLAAEGALYTSLGSHAAALTVLCLSALLAIPVVALLLRETAATELS